MASGGSAGRASSGPRSYDFGSDDVLCAYDDFANQDPNSGKRPDPSAKDFHENRTGRSLVNVYGQQDEYPKEEIISAVEKCMKKYADNLLRHLEGISGRLSQLEIYCYKLERSIGELRADMIRDQSEADTKLKSLEKHLQEVHRSIQILRDKQELAETQKELTKLQFPPKESSSASHSQKSEDTSASPSSAPPPKSHDDARDTPNHHLALALPHQIPASRAPDPNQYPVQTQQPQPAPAPLSTPQDRYVTNQQVVPYYAQQSQPLQHEQQYVQHRPQLQAPQPPPPPPQTQQSPAVNQVQPPQQTYPQYHQQWTQSPPQQFSQPPPQQPPTQPQLMRPHTPPTYSPETFSYSNRVETGPFTYGPSGSSVNVPTQPQSAQAPPPTKSGGYVSPSPYPPQSNLQGYSTMYNMDGARIQTYQPGSYAPASSVPGMQISSNIGGYQNPGAQMMRSHPYSEMIEKAVSMGYPREQVAAAVNRMAAESGQPVDFNALLDRLNSNPAAAGGPTRVWMG